jgi:hypothetical protein
LEGPARKSQAIGLYPARKINFCGLTAAADLPLPTVFETTVLQREPGRTSATSVSPLGTSVHPFGDLKGAPPYAARTEIDGRWEIAGLDTPPYGCPAPYAGDLHDILAGKQFRNRHVRLMQYGCSWLWFPPSE